MPQTFAHGYALLIGVGQSAWTDWSLPVTVKDVNALKAVLVGRYVVKRDSFSLKRMQQQLESKKLSAKAVQQVDIDGDMTASLGVAAAFVVEVAEVLANHINDKDFIAPYIGLGRFYRGQGFYDRARSWYEKCLAIAHWRRNLSDSLRFWHSQKV